MVQGDQRSAQFDLLHPNLANAGRFSMVGADGQRGFGGRLVEVVAPGHQSRHRAWPSDRASGKELRRIADNLHEFEILPPSDKPRAMGDPSAQLRAWLKDMATHVARGDERGCPLANAAVELPEKDHPARRVIEAFKTAQRERLVQLCAAAALAEPDMLADELFLLLEGARVAAQSMGRRDSVTGS